MLLKRKRKVVLDQDKMCISTILMERKIESKIEAQVLAKITCLSSSISRIKFKVRILKLLKSFTEKF